ncbi:unnamed protein product, partial [Mycena citricolor]
MSWLLMALQILTNNARGRCTPSPADWIAGGHNLNTRSTSLSNLSWQARMQIKTRQIQSMNSKLLSSEHYYGLLHTWEIGTCKIAAGLKFSMARPNNTLTADRGWEKPPR